MKKLLIVSLCLVWLTTFGSSFAPCSQQTESIDALLAGLKGEDSAVAADADIKLSKMGDKAIPALLQFIKEENTQEKVFGDKVHNADWRTASASALMNWTEEYKRHMANTELGLMTMRKIGRPAVDALIEFVVVTNIERANAAVEILGNLGDRKAVGPLIALFDSEEHMQHQNLPALCAALERLTGQKLGSDPAKWKAWWAKQKHD